MKTVKVSALIAGGMLSLTSICGLVLASSPSYPSDDKAQDDKDLPLSF